MQIRSADEPMTTFYKVCGFSLCVVGIRMSLNSGDLGRGTLTGFVVHDVWAAVEGELKGWRVVEDGWKISSAASWHGSRRGSSKDLIGAVSL